MKYIIDTGFFGLSALADAKDAFGSSLLAVTVAPDCANYEEVISAVAGALNGVPVYAGATKPTLRDDTPKEYAPETPAVKAEGTEHASNIIARFAKDEELTVVCLGPLTNVAIAIMKEPEAMCKIKKIIIAGGAQLGYGYVTETAEYNIYTDPEAADTVVNSGIPLVFVTPEACAEYRKAALQFALTPETATNTYEAFIDIDVSGSRTYGQTVVDPIGWNPINNQKHAGEKSLIVAEMKGECANA